MKYFIDFEATQYKNEIISIGCVAENGDSFSSYVHVPRGHMTNFITTLTGITKEDIANAPSADEVFRNFYYWIEYDSNPIFYCYGDCDNLFITKTMTMVTNNLALSALNTLSKHLVNYEPIARCYFGLSKAISLIRLVAYYRQCETIEQQHDALQDAYFLMEIYNHMATEAADIEGFLNYKVEIVRRIPRSKSRSKIRKKASQINVDSLRAQDKKPLVDKDNNPIVIYRTNKAKSKRCTFSCLYDAVYNACRIYRSKLEMSTKSNYDYNAEYLYVREEVLKSINESSKFDGYRYMLMKGE